MIKTFRERVTDFLQRGRVAPPITETSSLVEIAAHYPHVYEFVERKYGIKIDADEKPLSLQEFVAKFGLPPAQILFMEVQMSCRTEGVGELPAVKASELIRRDPRVRILDIREEWEVRICKLPGSLPLSPTLLDEILTEWPKDTPILMYCHHGVRSMDAATFLADRGFTKVSILKGGIEAWSLDVDPSLPRYEAAYC